VLRRATRLLVRSVITIVLIVLALIAIGLATIETGWAKNRIRGLLVRQANEYLTATLDIEELSGSLIRGLHLRNIRLVRDGKPLITIDEVALSYSIRELLQPGVVIRRVRLTRPHVVAGRQADGRWDLGALIKRESKEEERSGPGRPIEIQSIEIADGRISLRTPVQFGAAHIPTEYQSLNASASFAYYPVRWRVNFANISWIGREPTLDVTRMTGSFGRASGGWFFDSLRVESPRSSYTLHGHIDTDQPGPARFDLQARADRFAFQEWSGVLNGLKNIAVESQFETTIKGTSRALDCGVRLTGSGGGVSGRLTFDTSIPGWHGKGALDVTKLNLARWLNRDDRPSDITGHVTFDMNMGFGEHFPRGAYTFDGPHAMYMDYAADDLKARGQISTTEVVIAAADAVAYDAHVTTADSAIGIAEPYPFRFRGTAVGVDLRRVPKTVPVPLVESTLAFDYDVTGRFSNAYIAGRAVFRPSEFLGAAIGAGTVGTIDTSQTPIRFTGDGDVDRFEMQRVGEGLDVGWMRDPRYSGTIAGHFKVDGAGTDRQSLAMTAGGRLTRATLFRGAFSDADVSMTIDNGTLRASFAGRFDGVDPSIPFDDERLKASLSGTGRMTATVRDLLTAEKLTLNDYDIAGTMSLDRSTIGEVALDGASVDATLRNSTLTLTKLDASGETIAGVVNGSLDFRTESVSVDLTYDLSRLDLDRLRGLTGVAAGGVIKTQGRVTGPSDALHAVGDASVEEADAPGFHALAMTGHYDLVAPAAEPARMRAQVTGQASFLTVAGGSIDDAGGTIDYDSRRIAFDLAVKQAEARSGSLKGTVDLLERPAPARAIAIQDLTISIGTSPWRLVAQNSRPTVTWTDAGITVSPATFTSEGDSRIDIGGSWRHDGSDVLKVTASRVSLDTLERAFERPARYGGMLDVDASIHGGDDPVVDATISLTAGRVERVTYQRLTGRVDYARRALTLDLRLDQSPTVWLTAAGTLPIAAFASRPEMSEADGNRPVDVTVKSSHVDFGLIEGVTDVLRNVTGDVQLDVHALGTARDPHFTGLITIDRAGFLVEATGSRYQNGSMNLTLAADRITVNTLHIEDAGRRVLNVSGSLGTRELQVSDLRIDATAQRFEVLRNDFGRIDIDAALQLRGRFETPRLAGNLTIAGNELKVDEILQRVLFQPYSEEAATMTPADVDAVAALNPWNRLGLDLFLHVAPSMRLTGRNVQVSQNTPIGIGDINMRAGGDLYLYKDPAQPVSITGSLDRLSGGYVFQGRRFTVDEGRSSINFHGDLDPEIWVTVSRTISGVDTSVTVAGPLHQPELRLASNPPLDSSDILSLIVFNTSTNSLNAGQQQELYVRAGALAAGFLAGPLLSTVQNEIGIQTLEVDPGGDLGRGPKVTIGNELAPGLVAQFSRQFGPEPYDEATIEYYLTRILRLRATFSDAQSVESNSPFRRVERAGVDLLFFFSF
jgi:autotransporter translocation and assembly factor TamB